MKIGAVVLQIIEVKDNIIGMGLLGNKSLFKWNKLAPRFWKWFHLLRLFFNYLFWLSKIGLSVLCKIWKGSLEMLIFQVSSAPAPVGLTFAPPSRSASTPSRARSSHSRAAWDLGSTRWRRQRTPSRNSPVEKCLVYVFSTIISVAYSKWRGIYLIMLQLFGSLNDIFYRFTLLPSFYLCLVSIY